MEQTQEALAKITTPILPETFNKTPIVLDFGPLPTGMIEAFPVPSSLNFVVEEGWQDYVNDEYITLGAGYMANDPEQGAIIYSRSGDHYVVVKTSKKSGELKIKEVKGKKIVLVSKKGDTFFFDVPGRKFITTLDEVIATVTPSDQEKWKPQEPTPTAVPAYPFPQP